MTITRKKCENISYAVEEKICDDCGRIASVSDMNDTELLGFDSFNFGALHEPFFDLGMSYELDLCRSCVVKLFKPLLKAKHEKMLIEANERSECECENPVLLGNSDCPSIPIGYARCQICRLLIKI